MFFNLIDNNVLPFEEYILTEEQLNSYKYRLMVLTNIDVQTFIEQNDEYEFNRVFLISKNADKVYFLIIDTLGMHDFQMRFAVLSDNKDYILSAQEAIQLCCQIYENTSERCLTNIDLDKEVFKSYIIASVAADARDIVIKHKPVIKQPIPSYEEDFPEDEHQITPAEFAQISYLTKAVLKVIFNYDCTDADLANKNSNFAVQICVKTQKYIAYR